LLHIVYIDVSSVTIALGLQCKSGFQRQLGQNLYPK